MESLLEPSFLETLEEPLKSFIQDTLAAGGDAAADNLEILLRRHLAHLRQKGAATEEASIERIGIFWTNSLRVCYHVAALEDENPQFQAMNVRKVPFLMLEDVLDYLTVDHAKLFWQDYVEASTQLLFSQVLWTPAGKSRPCWLPFLKLCNNFIRRLEYAWSSRIMLTLARVYPISEKSASMKWGSRNTETLTAFETEKEFEKEIGKPEQQKSKEDDNTVGYSFYESFWSLQQDFASPVVQNLSSFLSRLRIVLQAFENQTSTTAELNPSDTTTTADSTHIPLPQKYLISSRLLPMQLSDSDFRTAILSQFLIVAHNLSLEAPNVGAQLMDLQHRAKKLLPNEYLSTLETILNSSEIQWRQWKKDKCPDFETAVQVSIAASKNRTRKRRLGGQLSDDNDDERRQYSRIDLIQDLPDISQTMKQLAPSVDAHLNDYVEALDPESGIEAEYHPKNNAYFNWQALRLLSMQNLNDFNTVHASGDFEAMVREVWRRDKGVDIAGEAPEFPEDDVEEDEQIEEEEVSMEEENADAPLVDDMVIEESVEQNEQVIEVEAEKMHPEETAETTIAVNGRPAEGEEEDESKMKDDVDQNVMPQATETKKEPKQEQEKKKENNSIETSDTPPRGGSLTRDADEGRARNDNNRGGTRADGNRGGDGRGGNFGNRPRHDDRDRGPNGGRHEESLEDRRRLDRRWEPARGRDERDNGGGQRRDNRSGGQGGGGSGAGGGGPIKPRGRDRR